MGQGNDVRWRHVDDFGVGCRRGVGDSERLGATRQGPKRRLKTRSCSAVLGTAVEAEITRGPSEQFGGARGSSRSDSVAFGAAVEAEVTRGPSEQFGGARDNSRSDSAAFGATVEAEVLPRTELRRDVA